MVSAAVLFEPGWQHLPVTQAVDDLLTGEPKPTARTPRPGSGLVQQPYWSSFEEVAPTSVKDGRVLLFRPANFDQGYAVGPEDEFVSPSGHVWAATSEGMPRGIPGQDPEYLAIQVRRTKEKDRG